MRISNDNLDGRWTKVVALSILFHNDFDSYDNGHFEISENYNKYIKDVEWLFDNRGIEDKVSSKSIVIRALLKTSKRTDILDKLIDETISSDWRTTKPFLKAANGVDINYEKLVNDEFSSCCKGYKDGKIKLNELVGFSEINEDWEAFLYEVFVEVHYVEGVLLRKSIDETDYISEGFLERLKSIGTQLTFNLTDRSYWDRSYLVPEDYMPMVFSKITGIMLNYFKNDIVWYIDYIKNRCVNQFGVYSEGYRMTLINIIKQFILLSIDTTNTIILIDILADFTLKNVENRWERTPELLMVNEFYNLVGENSKADNIFLEIMKTSMGPSWYKEDQFSILNTAFSLSKEGSDISKQSERVAYLLDEASGEMTFQRYVRHSKESFIGLLAKEHYLRKAIDYLKFEILPPLEILVENAEFYKFDQIHQGSGYSYGANNISIEAGVLSFLQNSEVDGYFGVMVPPVSVKPCHFKRYYNYIKSKCYSFLKAPFLKDSPLRSILWEEFTIRSRIASAIVPSPIISYQADTGIWDRIMVEDRL